MSLFGIDLGTTNSVIARMEGGTPRALAIDGSAIVPSVVLYGEGGVIVGREARNLALLHPERTLVSVKRSMGRAASLALPGRTVRPEEVSAEILKKLKDGAELATGETVRDVVVTAPAYFDDAQRRATLEAAQLAGLRVLRLLNEPTAAAMVYEQAGAVSDEPHLVLVYDLGGGTFDVSVLEMFGDVREVKATAGDTHLGGDDFDHLLVGRLRDELLRREGADVRGDPVAEARLLRLAEESKIALSAAIAVPVKAEFLTAKGGKAVHLDFVLRRAEFEDLIRPHIARTMDMALQAVTAAGLQAADIQRVCLVGGSTRIPLVRQMLGETFAADVHEEIDADLAVSLGAAVQAAVMQGETVERILVDIAAHDLGVHVRSDGPWEPNDFAPIIHRNTVLPTRREREFYTVHDGQPAVDVLVFQGNAPTCAGNRRVGQFEFKLKPAPSGSAVQCAFEYDLDGLVRVSVAQIGTKQQKTVALRLADATEAQVQAPAVPAGAVQRKAEALRERLSGPARERLDILLAQFVGAEGEQRVQAEEALLDYFVDHEA